MKKIKKLQWMDCHSRNMFYLFSNIVFAGIF